MTETKDRGQDNPGSTVAQVLAKGVAESGATHFFQVTGGDQSLWYALADEGIIMVPCRTEAGATYMADGYARASGRPGFVYGQHGPGATNVAAATADAYWASSPVVSITSSIARSAQGRFAYQEIDQIEMYKPVTRWCTGVSEPTDVGRLLNQAITTALTPPCGPTHIEIPRDMFEAEAGEFSQVVRHRDFSPAAPGTAALDEVLSLLAGAERPLILAGHGVLAGGASENLVRVAERLRVPVVTTLGGKGAIPEIHELSGGVTGRYAGVATNEIVEESDFILVIGSRLGELATDTQTVFNPSAVIVQVDIDPDSMGRTYSSSIGVHADAGLFLDAILSEVVRKNFSPTWADGWVESVVDRVRGWWSAVERIGSGEEIHPAEVIRVIDVHLRPGDTIVADTGYMAAWVGTIHRTAWLERSFLRASGSLGWALPASLGVQLARPQSRAITVIGDGGAGYHIAEIETAVRLGIPATIVVMNNRCLAFEYHLQRYAGGRVLPSVNDFTDVSYAAVAEAFGGEGLVVRDSADLDSALKTSLASDVPTVVEVMIDREAIAPVTSYKSMITRVI